MKPSNRLCLALDIDTMDQAWELIQATSPYIGVYKIGMQAFYTFNTELFQPVRDVDGTIFLDLKLIDIPNTVAAAARVLTRLKISYLTLHTLGGYDMMAATKRAVVDEANKLGIDPPRLLGVTVLTSLDQPSLQQIGISDSVENQVLKLAKLAQSAGLDGIVASANEAEAIRTVLGKEFQIVTPGIRLASDDSNDQKRTTTPEAALEKGASMLVIGRSITQAKYPKVIAAQYYQSVPK